MCGYFNLIKNWLRPFYYKYYFLRKVKRQHNEVLQDIRNKGEVNVVFFASTLSMWRYQGIYDLLKRDARFNLTIILSPISTLTIKQNEDNIKVLRDFFDKKNISYEDSMFWNKEQYDIRSRLKPDILFYVQPSTSFFNNELDNVFFFDRLFCYVPYGVGAFTSEWHVNSIFQNVAWKLYYETEVYKKNAINLTYNKGENIVVVGNTNADEFLRKDYNDVWKPQQNTKKRIIWAPHFTIERTQTLQRGSFLWLNEVMLKIAEEYQDKIQFVFKPHPRLRSVLSCFPGWGEERTDKYYESWENLSNGQYENSSFVDLFMTSDAMIHDCGSFTVEYHYSKNPCLFTTKNLEGVRHPLNEFGRAALDAHYIGSTENDVRQFIGKVVLEGNDSKKKEREDFFNKYLLPPNGKSVAQNIYDDIVKSIWG